MSNDVPWRMPHNFRSEGVQKTVDRYTSYQNKVFSTQISLELLIVNRQGSLEWVAEYGAGEVANSTEELVQITQKIGANYEKYAERALSCYQEYFAFEKYYPPIHRAIRELI
jgi:hypothetical protein